MASTNYTLSHTNGTFTVSNDKPVITVVTGPNPTPVGSGGTASAAVNVSFTDPGVVGDLFVISSVWTRGGGAPVTVPGTQSTYNGTSGTGTITANGLVAGVYTVVVTVKDKFNTTSDPYEYRYVVVYDPNGGFITGGGWIDSPAGAYVAAPGLAGKAHFGFVSKYKKGQSVPDGNTEFQFQAAGFNFKSTSYEWLVIAGSKAQFKGSGTINGSGDYFFMLTATDSELKGKPNQDTFRMKVWHKNSNIVIYDNLLDAPDAEDLLTQLGGGSIQIHAK